MEATCVSAVPCRCLQMLAHHENARGALTSDLAMMRMLQKPESAFPDWVVASRELACMLAELKEVLLPCSDR